MEVFKTIDETRKAIEQAKAGGLSVGFVPTMGALHEGHVSLLQRSASENDITACSVFVNPIQFNNPEDLKMYPRDLEKDISLMESAGCTILFAPEVKEMYPDKVEKTYDFGHLDKIMEGQFRPGHFNGVAVVVSKLFDIVTPDRAYFGEKDFQQLAIIQKLVEMEGRPVTIVSCHIVREDDGLAMSSRNLRLSPEERKEAVFIFKTLTAVKDKVPDVEPEALKRWAVAEFEENNQFRLEYFDIVGTRDLLPVSTWKGNQDVIACVAAFLGPVRLIDNIILFRNFAP